MDDLTNEFNDGHDPQDNEIMDRIYREVGPSNDKHVEFLKKAAQEDADMEREREARKKMLIAKMAANANAKLKAKKERPDS